MLVWFFYPGTTDNAPAEGALDSWREEIPYHPMMSGSPYSHPLAYRSPLAMLPGPLAGLDERVLSALALARPMLSGMQHILPYVQHIGRRIGTKRLTIAGVVVAGTAGAAAAGDWLRRQREKQRGTMQGGALSPLLANIYLHPFDQAITSQGFRMVRFMDDFVIMCARREDAEQAMELARKQLATLRLVLNEEKTQIVNYEDGLEFLGQALVPRQHRSALPQGWTSFAEAAEALRRSSVHALKRSGSKKNNTKR